MTRPSGVRRHSIFAMPAVLAIASLAGLVIGLLGDGFIDLAAWLALALPLAAILWSFLVRRS
jgi:hypothetical protein